MRIVDRPEDIGLSRAGLQHLADYMNHLVHTDRFVGAAVGLSRDGLLLRPLAFGRMTDRPDAEPVKGDTIFLTASVTKPVTCAAIGCLIEEGRVELDTPVIKVIPEFGQNGKQYVLIRHLLTHTSGLPDMIPENIAYRKRFAPLSDFLNRIYELDLLFEPGTDIHYQSAGIAVLGEVVKRLTGVTLPDYLRRTFFEPLGMSDTALGSAGIQFERVANVRLPAASEAEDWSWNKPYWRGFGAPWGGLFSTVRDMNLFLQMFLKGGTTERVRVLRPETTALMIQNHSGAMSAVSDASKGREARGLGWRINEPRSTYGIEKSPSARTFGHNGATGTVAWADPESGLSCAIFTSQPNMCDSEEIRRCSDLAVAADIQT